MGTVHHDVMNRYTIAVHLNRCQIQVRHPRNLINNVVTRNDGFYYILYVEKRHVYEDLADAFEFKKRHFSSADSKKEQHWNRSASCLFVMWFAKDYVVCVS